MLIGILRTFRVATAARGRRALAAAAVLAMCVPLTAVAQARAAAAVGPPQAVTGNSSAYDWSTFHKGPFRQGYASNSPLSTANAGNLGVTWAANLYSAAVDSPVVYYDASLGKTLSIIGTQTGEVIAVNVATGRIVWSTWVGSPIMATPVVASGAVFIGTYNSPRIYKLNASTGATECSLPSPQPIDGTPLAVTPAGGVDTVYFGTNDSSTANGPLLAVKVGNCALEWSFTGYVKQSGTWDPSAYGVDAKGVPLVLFGSADPDSEVYAVNAVTGAEVWHFAAYNPSPGVYDIGAGVTVSPPKANGFADGVAYVSSKYGVMYALDLTTGKKIWAYNYRPTLGVTEGTISTAALVGNNLVFGYQKGLADFSATTGKLIWSDKNPAGAVVDSAPAVSGPKGSQVVVVGDLAGGVDVVSLATGQQLYHYQTGNYITASPAVTDGNLLIASADGYLYDFAVGGGNEATLPDTTISSPADSSTVANPNGNLTVTGTASDQAGVYEVMVAVQAKGANGPWWDATTKTWVSGPIGNPLVFGKTPTSTHWNFSYPVPPAGGTYQVTAYAVSKLGQSDITAAQSGFAVRATTSGPYLKTSSAFVAPGSNVTVTGGGFANAEQVAIGLPGSTPVTVTATANGQLPATKIPFAWNTPFGQTSVTATGKTSGRVATAAVTVANSWAEAGYGATHRSYEPNDSVFFNSISPGGNIFLDLAWLYQTSAPLDASAAITHGVAYAGNGAGQLTALDVHNSAPLWTWNMPSGAAIDGSPAVDPSVGLAFVGASDGALYAVSTTTGKLVWEDNTIGGSVYAPVYGNGVVYVTSSNGTVKALVERTGQASWSTTLSAVSAAPALDTAGQKLVVGESNGDVVALTTAATATSRTLWTNTSGSGAAVAAAPAIYGGNVYFPSGDSVYAVAESNGHELWSYATGGPVSDTPAVSDKVYFGSGDGNLYALQTSGALAWKLPVGHPVTGVAAVFSVVTYVTSSGVIGASRTWEGIDLWRYSVGSAVASPPVIDDGAVYVGAADGDLRAFTTYGRPPQ